MNPKNFLKLGKKLWPINRSITGIGVRQTLKILKRYNNNLRIIKFQSGKKVFDWTVPNEWEVREAWIKDQYDHPVERTHSFDEVLNWFNDLSL